MATKRHQLFVGNTAPINARLGDLWSDTSSAKPVSRKCISAGPPAVWKLSEIALGTEAQTLRYNGTTEVWEANSILRNDGTNVGIGVAGALTEKFEVGSGIKIGSRGTANPMPGLINFTGTDYEAYIEGAWRSLTAGSAAQSSSQGSRFKGVRSENQTIAHSTKIKVQINSVEFDSKGEWDAGNYRFIAKEAGYYQVNGNVKVLVNDAAAPTQVFIYKQGVQSSIGCYTNKGYPAVSDLVYLDVGQFVELYAGQWGGSSGLMSMASFSVSRADQLAVGAGAVANTGHQTTKVSVGKSSAQAIPNNTWTKITHNLINFDTNNEFDITNSKFIAKQAGYYSISAQTYMANAMDPGSSIYKNGILIKNAYAGAAANSSLSVYALVYLVVGDEIEHWFYHYSGSTKNIDINPVFTNLSISRCDPLTGGLGGNEISRYCLSGFSRWICSSKKCKRGR